jgi:RNA repair, ligase-Pnkp-associating, region of Hen1
VTVTLKELLAHLYVLIPVLDDEKHYWIDEAEVEKLLRRGDPWLAQHPKRELIVARYLKRRRPLVTAALSQLIDEEGAGDELSEDSRGPNTLHTQRLESVVAILKARCFRGPAPDCREAVGGRQAHRNRRHQRSKGGSKAVPCLGQEPERSPCGDCLGPAGRDLP